MPVFEPAPHTQDAKPNVAATAPARYHTNVVDTDYHNRKSLVSHVEGMRYRVNYYAQALGKDDGQAGLDVGRNAAREQFILIKNLTLVIQSAIQGANQEQKTKYLNVNGEAIITAGVVPNEGDHFVMDVGDGRVGVFSVTRSELLSVLKDSAYRIDYKLERYMDDTVDYHQNWKVIQTYYEYGSEMRYGYNTILEEGAYTHLQNAERKYDELLQEWVARYWSNEFHVLLVPGNPGVTTYDHHLDKHVQTLYRIEHLREYRNFKVLNVTDDYNVMTCQTLWDALRLRRESILRTGVREMGVARTNAFSWNPSFTSIRYTGIQDVVYPRDGSKKIDYHVQRDLTRSWREYWSLGEHLRNESLDQRFGPVVHNRGFLEGSNAQPLIGSVMGDDYYVFSEAFYNGSGQTMLEIETRRYIQGENPSPEIVMAIVEQRPTWGPLEDFYYTPVLLNLLYGLARSL